MFGNNDNSQPQSGPVTSPTTNDNQAAPVNNDVNSVFPPSNDGAGDPFGTSPAQNDGVGMQPHADEPVAATNNLFEDVTAGANPVHADEPALPAPAEPAATVGDNGLIDIKQEALQQLSPLVKHLDQSSEEKFKTTMMMIQATDNKDLVPEAFESAKAIEDDKARAQALLDIINEINYFTQSNHNQ